MCFFLVDTNRVDAGILSADITLNDKKVKFEMNKVDGTKYEIKLLPRSAGIYKVRLLLNGLTVKGSPFVIKIDSGTNLEKDLNLIAEKKIGPAAMIKPESNMPKTIAEKAPVLLSKPPVILIRTEMIECTDKNDLVVGKEFKFSSII